MAVVIVPPAMLAQAQKMAAQGMALEDVCQRTRVPMSILVRAIEADKRRDLATWQTMGARKAG